jgi:light-regulated signal transduction histidine kinase (bacteriophytochrome)
VILLLVKGKPLEVKAIKFPSDLIAVDPDCEIKWWNFMPTDIPEKSFDQLALKPWKHPRFAAAEELRDSMPHLVLLSAHVKDFERLPDSDDIGNELLQAYVNELNSLLCEAFQSTLDKMSGLLSYFTQLSDVQKSNRQHLILAIAALGRMHEQVLPQESCVKDGNIELTMNFEDICKWSEQLDLAQSLVSAVYLYWVSDVIEEMQISEVDTYSHN